MDAQDAKKTRIITETGLAAILLSVALIGPAVAYAGVEVVWPPSETEIDVNQDPPITFGKGRDYRTARENNFTEDFAGSNNNASYNVTLSGLSGGRVTVDQYINLTIYDSVDSFNVEIDSELSGTLEKDNVTLLKMRIWNSSAPNSSAPTADNDTEVRCVLDLEQPEGNHTGDYPQGGCELPGETVEPGRRRAYMQMILELEDGQTTESATVGIRPMDIVFS